MCDRLVKRSTKEASRIETDVVVVGAGGSGLAAAVETMTSSLADKMQYDVWKEEQKEWE